MASPLPPSIPERFRILRDLAPSLGPATWLVEDRLSPNRRCVLSASAPDASEETVREEVERIRALLRVRHPRLTPVVAARVDPAEGPAFFVVERPEGTELAERFRAERARSAPAAYRTLRRVIVGLCQALEYLHQRGVIHHDLRPARIVIDVHDEPVLVGFGLAAPELEDTSREPSALGYTAPEILRGDPVDHRSDLYSLGVVLYEILTGRNPFLGADATETARAHLELLPPPPSALDATVPRDLDEVVTLLLAKNPSRSFASAIDVASAIGDAPAATRRRRLPPLSPYAFTQNEHVGRLREQRLLTARFRALLAGRVPIAPVVLLGEAGVGKSRLLAEFRQRVRFGGGAFLLGRATGAGDEPLGPIAECLRRAAELAPEDEELARETAALLQRADETPSGTTRARRPPGKAPTAPEPIGERAAKCLARAAARVPLVVAIDDVHRLEPDAARTLEALIAAAGRSAEDEPAPRVLFCLAGRETAELPAWIRRLASGSAGGVGATVLRLRELSRREMREFVSTIFGSGPAARSIAELLEQTAGGNPYLLEETIRSWIARGLVRWSDGLWAVDPDRVRSTTADLRTLVLERLRELPASSERWLRLAALLSRPLTHHWIEALRAHAPGDPEPPLADLFRRGFLRRFVRGGEDRYEIAHALLADAVVHATPEAAKRELHRAIADALESSADPATPRDPFEIAQHRLRGGDALSAASTLIAASQGKGAASPGPERVGVLEDLIRALPAAAAERPACLRLLGEAWLEGAELRAAAEALEASIRSAEEHGALAELAHASERLATVRRGQGDDPEALRLLRAALAAASRRGDPNRRASILEQIGTLHLENGSISRAERILRRALREYDVRANPDGGATVRLALARVARERGDLETAAEWLGDAASRLEASLGGAVFVDVRLEQARLAAARADMPESRRRLDEALRAARALGRRTPIAQVELERARLRELRGDRAGAMAEARAALVELRRSRARSIDATTLLGHLASQRGEHPRALRLFDAADAAGGKTESLRSRSDRAHARFLDRLRAGDSAGSARAAREGLRLARRLESRNRLARARTDAAEHFRSRARTAAAERMYRRVVDETRGARGPFAESRFRALLGQARLNMAESRHDEGARRLDAARSELRQLRRFPELSDLRAAMGEHALAVGDAARAERAFLGALRVDDRLDRPVERADDLQGLARAALLAGNWEAAWARAKLAEDALESIPVQPGAAARPGAELRAWLEEVKVEASSRRAEVASQREIDLLRGMARLQREIADGRGDPGVAERMARFAAQRLRGERAYVFLERRGGAVLVAATTCNGDVVEPDAATLTAARRGAVGLPDSKRLLARRTWIEEPLVRGGTPIGSLAVEASVLQRRFDERDGEDLRTLAALASLALGGAPSSRSGAPAPSEAEDRPSEESHARLVGGSSAMRRLRRWIARAAASQVNALVRGETGTGKELVARAIHASSAGAGPLVIVSCASLSRELAEAELFGHERGAFSGAETMREGLLERAAGGTIVLDGVEDMEASVQRAILRAIETGEVRRLGGSEVRRIRFRTIATTNVDLEAAARDGSFRSDLLYRLRGLLIEIPPLRERRDDILPMVEHFLATLASADTAPRLTPAAVRAMLEFPWPGNARELRAEVSRWIVHRLSIVRRADLSLESPTRARTRDDTNFARKRADFEREALVDALQRSGGRVTAAARWLRMPRSTFYLKARAYGLPLSRGSHLR